MLKLGIPKGSLQDATIALFEKSGWKIRMHHRNYFPEINDPELTCSMCRAQEMSRYVESGTLDCGLTGKDWILENESDVVVVADLVYSKVSNRPARWFNCLMRATRPARNGAPASFFSRDSDSSACFKSVSSTVILERANFKIPCRSADPMSSALR